MWRDKPVNGSTCKSRLYFVEIFVFTFLLTRFCLATKLNGNATNDFLKAPPQPHTHTIIEDRWVKTSSLCVMNDGKTMSHFVAHEQS